MSSRETILKKLRSAQTPFTDVPPIEPSQRKPMALVRDTTPEGLLARFRAEAEKVLCKVYDTASPAEALDIVRDMIGADAQVMAWDWAHIPLAGLAQALDGVQVAPLRDGAVRVGITGADAGIAATGSLVLVSGAGKARQASLLPPVHVAILEKRRILPDLETWFAQAQAQGTDTFRASANIVLVTGPSRTADIAMELIMGMHGPKEVHIVLV